MLCEDTSTAHDRVPSSSIVINRFPVIVTPSEGGSRPKVCFPDGASREFRSPIGCSAKVTCSPHFRADASRTGRLSRRVSGNNVSSRARHVGNVTPAIHRYSRQSAFSRVPSLTVYSYDIATSALQPVWQRPPPPSLPLSLSLSLFFSLTRSSEATRYYKLASFIAAYVLSLPNA